MDLSASKSPDNIFTILYIYNSDGPTPPAQEKELLSYLKDAKKTGPNTFQLATKKSRGRVQLDLKNLHLHKLTIVLIDNETMKKACINASSLIEGQVGGMTFAKVEDLVARVQRALKLQG